jgi:hypothetical protein
MFPPQGNGVRTKSAQSTRAIERLQPPGSEKESRKCLMSEVEHGRPFEVGASLSSF